MNKELPVKKAKVKSKDKVKLKAKAKKTTKKDASMISFHDYVNCRTKKFYYVTDLKFTLGKLGINFKNKKKPELLKLLDEHYNSLKSFNQLMIKKYGDEVDTITKIQSLWRGKQLRNIINTIGYAGISKHLCHNQEDFFTFESIFEIPEEFVFSYKDQDNFVYYFDIRSFRKLTLNDNKNPYTRNDLPLKAVKAMKARIKYLKDNKLWKELPEDELTPEQKFNEKVLSIFQKMDCINASAGGTDVNWFLKLSLNQLKNFYRALEDIWNYRAELTEKQKRDIVPLNNVFKLNMPKLMNMTITQGRKLQNIVLDEIDKLVSSSPSEVHRSTGCYYVLTALVEVSPECAQTMPWLVQAY